MVGQTDVQTVLPELHCPAIEDGPDGVRSSSVVDTSYGGWRMNFDRGFGAGAGSDELRRLLDDPNVDNTKLFLMAVAVIFLSSVPKQIHGPETQIDVSEPDQRNEIVPQPNTNPAQPESKPDPITPRDTVDWYLDHRRDDTRRSTRRKQKSALDIFVRWSESVGIDDLTALSGRDLMRFKTWRKEETEVNTVSLNGNLAIIRRFLRFCETIDAVPPDFAERVPMPNVPPREEVSDVVPDDEAVKAMRAYYREFEYASRRQCILDLIAEVGLRMGEVRAIDFDDFHVDQAKIELQHRPEGPDVDGTPLKNGFDGERVVNLSKELTETTLDYTDHNRVDVRDDYDRAPLFTTKQGRITTATMRRDFYKLTRPCVYSGECPHDRDIQSCEATTAKSAVECPSSFSTHPLRRWSIMNQLDAGVPKDLLSDRVDVSVPVLEKHYDRRSEERKSKARREELQDNLPEYSDE